eukprot:COSAG01_NODE_15167_length_1366_cov_2.105762_2_plen_176_part_00
MPSPPPHAATAAARVSSLRAPIPQEVFLDKKKHDIGEPRPTQAQATAPTSGWQHSGCGGGTPRRTAARAAAPHVAPATRRPHTDEIRHTHPTTQRTRRIKRPRAHPRQIFLGKRRRDIGESQRQQTPLPTSAVHHTCRLGPPAPPPPAVGSSCIDSCNARASNPPMTPPCTGPTR